MEARKDLFDLTSKVAVVTGATGILGRHFCDILASHGAEVAVLDLSQKETVKFARELSQKRKTRVEGYECDVSDPDSVQHTVQKILADFGHIDVLHNNAASKSQDLEAFFAPFEEYQLSQWREIMSVNIDGMFLMAQAVGRHMVQRRCGSIIQTASIYAVVAPDQRIYEGSYYLSRKINTPAVYSASKAAVIGLTRYLATYWGEYGIRVNTLTPGGVESGQNKTFTDRYSARVPLGRMATPQDMVGALLFLASDASAYYTGQNIIVDGGLSTW